MTRTTLTLILVSTIATIWFAGSLSGAAPAGANLSQPAPVPSPSPIQLVLEEGGPTSDQVAAVDATLYSRDPFLAHNPENTLNGTANPNTRIGIFVVNLVLGPGESPSDVMVNLIDSENSHYDVPAQAVLPVPGFSFTEVVFRLPNDIAPGECQVQVKWHDQVTNTGKLRIRRPKPVVTFSPVVTISGIPVHRPIYLPDNCPVEFKITNTGPKWSILDYVVADDGALGGFLNVEHSSGSLPSGAMATVRVSVKPEFNTPSQTGSTFVLNVYTPGASNFVKVQIFFPIREAGNIQQELVGGWSGLWSGTSFGPNAPGQPSPTAAIGGNWVLSLQAVDVAHQTAAGTLTWTGKDIYWTSTTLSDGTFVATPHDFIPNRTIQFDASNTTLTYAGFAGCNHGHRFHLTIDGAKGAPNPSDKFYGPWFSVELNTDLGTAISTGNGFLTHPYNPATFATGLSNGNVTGAKSP
ncbi:MAG TPA: hypothetical protein VFZ40_00680 [Pyrinomonadaceae bacterium]